jgi:superfamily I DNA and/or RNA helicase
VPFASRWACDPSSRTRRASGQTSYFRLARPFILSWLTAGASQRRAVIGLNDILIIAPYNAQVFELQDRIKGGRIGTVDKFQGQQAPLVIYSITTSSYLDAPHGIEFLYGSNRLNVATSRARAICVLVGSPAVFNAECRTPRQMQLLNAFCRYLEMATSI